jgi:SAM-dependent methyltransferase
LPSEINFGHHVSRYPAVPRRIYRWFFPLWIQNIRDELAGCDTVLDLGCGNGINSPIEGLRLKHSVGVDLFEPYIQSSRKSKIHSEYIHADIRDIEFKNRSFDAVLMLRVLEHMDKSDGQNMIAKCSRWAGKKVIIVTPNGYLPQEEFDDNPLQEHKSAWLTDDFISAGYTVHGINGWKGLRGYRGLPKLKPRLFGELVSDISQKLTYSRPRTAFQLLAVKPIMKG